MEKIVVDARGKQCPIPVVEAKKALGNFEGEGIVEVHVDNTTAVENLKRLAGQSGCSVSQREEGEAHYVVEISRSGEQAKTAPGCGCETMTFALENTVYVFDGDTMGRGSEELGRVLMKGCIYAVSQLEKLPKTCIFYNSGAKLTAEGSDSLADIKAMEEKGVEILTCGTCADFFQVKDKIKVGAVTNMYTIVETLNAATKIVKP